MTTTELGNRKLTPYNLAIDLGSQGESCSVKLMPTDGQRFLAFQQPLPAEYCDLHDQNQLVFAIEVDQGSAQGQSTNSISSLCLSNMEVVSELVR